jgi:diacylglycerol kinase (ATP)
MSDLDAVLNQLVRLTPARIAISRSRGDAERQCQTAMHAGFNYVVVAGGDGTLNEVVNAVVLARRARDVRIGILPLGTGNDFGRTLRLPATLADNIDILRDPTAVVRQIDFVRAKGARVRYFVNTSVGGFTGEIGQKLSPRTKQSWGPLAYLRGAAAALPKLRCYPAEIIFDDARQISGEFYNVIVANGRYAGCGVPVAPEADPSDRRLDVILIPRLPPADLVIAVAEMLLGTHARNQNILHRRATKVAIRSHPRMRFNVDGEPFGMVPLSFQLTESRLNFVTARA